jgi:hypothetical protein
MSKKWLVAMSLSIFLLTGLSTSSFFLTDFLTQAIENNEHTNRQLNFAINQNNEAAILFAIKKSKQGSDTWQTLAKKLAKKNGEFAYLLAEFYLANVSERENSSDNLKKVKFWYQQAIRLNYSKASISLAKLNFQEGNILMAQNILDEFQGMDIHQPQQNDDMISAMILTLKIAINIGNTDLVNKLSNKYSSLLQVNKQGSQLLSLMAKYRILPVIDDQNNVSVQSSLTCANSIQFFATSLSNLTKLDKLVSNLKNNSLSPFVCYTPIRYLPISSLSCISEQEHPIECNESKLYGVAESINTRYAAIMLPKGGANVHFGILYFDEHDSVDVLEHEISHLLGFVDEYPLSKGHVKCQATQQKIFSQNIAVLNKRYKGQQDAIRQNILKQLPWAKQIKETTPILQLNNTSSDSENEQYWALGTPESFEQEVGLFKAQTCDNNTVKQRSVFSAFKPLISRTKLQYNELNLPKEYITLLAVNKDKFLMPSFHYNIALAYYQQNNLRLASKWLEKSIKLESNEYRREKVREGDF